MILSDLATFSHVVTRLKLIPGCGERSRTVGGRAASAARISPQKLSVRTLSRAWQILLKGIPEVQALEPTGRGGRDGAGASRLRGRPADARRGAARLEGRRARRRPAVRPRLATRRAFRLSGNMALATLAAATAVQTARSSGRSPAARSPAPFRGCGGARRRAARDRAQGGPRTGCPSRPLRGRQHRIQPGAGRQPHGRQRSLARPPAMDGTTVDGGRSRPKPARRPCTIRLQPAERERKEGAANHPLVQAVLSKFPAHRSSMWIERSGEAAEDTAQALDPLGPTGSITDSDDDL